MFEQLEEILVATDRTIRKETFGANTILVSGRSCSDLHNIFGVLRFKIQNTNIAIRPEGYLYSLPNQDDCFIGIQKLPRGEHHIRLGTIFLRNFYVGLDFGQNMVLLGLNQGSDRALMDNRESNPNVAPKPNRHGTGALFFILLFLFMLFIISLVCYLRAKKNERDRTVTFSTNA